MRRTFALLTFLSLGIAFIALSAVARSQGEAPRGGGPREHWTVIHCGTLLATPGRDPVSNATVVVKGNRVAEVIARKVDPKSLPGAADADVTFVDLSDCFVLPGLIDCHTHITWELSRDARVRMFEDSDADLALNGAMYARRTLEAGFTTIRNVGSTGDAGFALRDAIAAGKVPGPRILEAGNAVTPTGGHGDRTLGWREDLFSVPDQMAGVADGVDECRRAVRSQVKRGADVIKLTATGGVMSNTAAGTEQQFFDDELLAIVETAHQLGRKVAAHAHGTSGINAALRAGVDSIEHGSYLDDESIRLFKERGAFLVPTLHAGMTVVAMASDPSYPTPPAVRAKALAVGPVMKENFARAHAAGVKIAFGTDCGVGIHGTNALEFTLMAEAGMKPMDAIVAATINAAELCGLSREIGTIEAGKAADIIAVRRSPLEDLSEFQRVAFVMRAGVAHVDR